MHRFCVYGKPALVQHGFSILAGFALGYWNYGWDMLHTVFAIGVTYGLLLVLGGTAISVGLVFVFNLTYLLLGNTIFQSREIIYFKDYFKLQKVTELSCTYNYHS